MSLTYELTGAAVQLNSLQNGRQTDIQIGARPDGGYVAAWTTFQQDGDREGIAFRIFDRQDRPLTAEVQANQITDGIQDTVDIAMADDGSFTLIWVSFGVDGSGRGIAARNFTADGTPTGDEFVVNTETDSEQRQVVASRLESGTVAAAWESFAVLDGDRAGIGTRLVGPNDAGEPDRVANTTTIYNDLNPAIAALPGGGYVVEWEDDRLLDGSRTRTDLRAQIFDAGANPVGDEIFISSGAAGDQTNVTVAGTGEGGFVVSWIYSTPSGGGEPRGIVGQRYDAAGTPIGDRFEIGGIGNVLSSLDLIPLEDGGFAAAWDAGGVFVNQQEVVPGGIYIRVYDEDGIPTTEEAFLTGDVAAVPTEVLDLVELSDGTLGVLRRDLGAEAPGADLVFQRIALVDATSTEPTDGDDLLTADGSASILAGGPGDDRYFFDDPGDRASEAPGEGTDTIVSSADVTLADAEIERVELTGGASLRVTGNASATEIVGNAGDNILIGGGGGDALEGGAGRDFFVFLPEDASGVALITDFDERDFIAFDDRFFGLGDEGVDVRLVSAAQVSNALRTGLVEYDPNSGRLAIDPDGRGGPADATPILEIEGGGRIGPDDVILF